MAQLRIRPTVQGAALVLENKTGRILAMAGGFSYPLSQLNRTWQTQRQPGSAIKPITYLTALQKGLQPNTLIPNDPITLPPIGSATAAASPMTTARPIEDDWSPRNADYSSGGVFTLRRGLENSMNVITAHLLDGGIDGDPVQSLDDVCATAKAAKIYTDCVRYYPFVLGAQPVHMINLAAFYAAIANEGARPQPHAIDSIQAADGSTVYAYPSVPTFAPISAADAVSFYQLKTMLQGVVARGTARAIGALSPYVAGKTGTTEDAVDGWFVGFTNDVTIAVWVGYDNGDRKRRSLGSNETGARVALPIFKPIIEDIWAEHIAPKAPLAGPSPEAARQIVDMPIDYTSGTPANARAPAVANNSSEGFNLFTAFGNPAPPPPPPSSGPTNFVEHFRRGTDGKAEDTQYQIVSREDADARQSGGDNFYYGGNYGGGYGWCVRPRGRITPIRAGRSNSHLHRRPSHRRVGCFSRGPRSAPNSRRRGRIIIGAGAITDALTVLAKLIGERIFMAMRHAIVLLGLLGFSTAAGAQDFSITDVGAAAKTDVAQLKPGSIAFSDQWGGDAATAGAQLIHFDDWAIEISQSEEISGTVSVLHRADHREARERRVRADGREALHVRRASPLHRRPRAKRHRSHALCDFGLPRPDRSGDQAYAAQHRRYRAIHRRPRHRQ